jgi:hypothetical protein
LHLFKPKTIDENIHLITGGSRFYYQVRSNFLIMFLSVEHKTLIINARNY